MWCRKKKSILMKIMRETSEERARSRIEKHAKKIESKFESSGHMKSPSLSQIENQVIIRLRH
jgi:hypothetical protein